MMHRSRRWCLAIVDSAEDLAEKLTGHTWTLCTGFIVRGHEDYLFLNDSTCEDAAAEFAVVRRTHEGNAHVQIESITFSWCSPAKALEHIAHAINGRYDESSFANPINLDGRLDTAESHERCHLCA